jgi:hypothetical protein
MYMGNYKFEINPELKDASLTKACDLLNALCEQHMSYSCKEKVISLHYMMEYLRLNYDLVPKKG